MFSFREVEISDAKMILDWRTSDRVTKYMVTDVADDVNAQERWIRSSYLNPAYYHWIIRYNEQDIGLIQFMRYDQCQKSASWGFYVGEEPVLKQSGLIPAYFYNFAFNFLGVEKIKTETFYDNTSVLKLHLLYGYDFSLADSEVIEKNGKKVLLVCMNLSKESFYSSKFNRFKAEFPIAKWKGLKIKDCLRF